MDLTSTGGELQDGRSDGAPRPVDNTDWLKTAAIILVATGHFGQFFLEEEGWWSVIGCSGAPMFFFLLGYARTRTIPLRWIGLGVILTLLGSWNADWAWEAPNILLSFALIRLARPRVESLLWRHGWTALALLSAALIAVLPVAGSIVDYGAEGWLWALFGLCQSIYADPQGSDVPVRRPPGSPGPMRLLSCALAAGVFVWQEQMEYTFSREQLAALVVGTAVLATVLCHFRRGPSRIQPPQPVAAALRFLGRHTLEIYAIQLAASELIIQLLPDLAP